MQNSDWYSRRLRVVQTILRTADVPGFDAGRLVDYCLSMKADTLAINGAGLFAFYPTKIEGHQRVPGLESDILGAVIERAHRSGLKVLGRIDFRAGHEDYYLAHPQFFARSLDGQPLAARGLYSVAATSPYRNEAFAFPVVRELLDNYDLDGIWENAAGFMHLWKGSDLIKPDQLDSVRTHGANRASFGLIDYSACTREAFRQETGYELPTPDHFDFEAYAEFMRFRSRVVNRRTAAMSQLVHSYDGQGPDGAAKVYVSEVGTQLDVAWGHGSGQNLEELAPNWNLVTSPSFDLLRGSRGSVYYPTPVWRAEESVKLLQAANPAVPPTYMFGRFDNNSRYTTCPPAQLEASLAGAVAQGAGLWECTFVGRESREFLDQRCGDIVARYYSLLEAQAAKLGGQASLARVAVLFSRPSEDWLASSDPELDDYVQAVRGLEAVLFAAHIPFDFVTDKQLAEDAAALAGYQAVCLPDTACLSAAACERLHEYVCHGGGLLATHRVALFDEQGRPRAESGLADLLGVHTVAEPALGPLTNGYARLAAHDELIAGLEQTEVVTIEGRVQRVSLSGSASVTTHLRLIEDIVSQPPELGWIEDMSGDLPLLVTNQAGAGRVAYFAGQVDKLALTAGHPDYFTLLANAVSWVGQGRVAPFRTDAPASVHINLMSSPAAGPAGGSRFLHFVNYTGGPGRLGRQVVPVRGITVDLPWADGQGGPGGRAGSAGRVEPGGGGLAPAGPRLPRVRELISGHDLPCTVRSGDLRFCLPELGAYALVEISQG